MKQLIAALLLCFSFTVLSQDDENWRVVPSITEWIEEINNWPDTLYFQRYLEVQFDPERDKNFVIDRDSALLPPEGDQVSINKALELRHFRIINQGFAPIKNLVFEKSVYIEYIEGLFLGFSNLHFNNHY